MKNILIVTGGSTDTAFLDAVAKGLPDFFLIGVDRGVEACTACALWPDLILGDFDSAAAEAVKKLEALGTDELRLNPVKDSTDTEEALDLALTRYPGVPVTIVGGSGTRIDHMLSTLSLLKKGLDVGTEVVFLDQNNRIRVFTGRLSLGRHEQYGSFVSILPFYGDLENVTIEGAKYNIKSVTIPKVSGLGVSNEITADTMSIDIGEGVAFLIESKD